MEKNKLKKILDDGYKKDKRLKRNLKNGVYILQQATYLSLEDRRKFVVYYELER